MGAIFGIVAGIAIGSLFVALGLGLVPMDGQLPVVMRIIFGLMGALTVLASLASIRFRIKRRIAIENGRERKGTVTLRGRIDDESSSAVLLFATAYDTWMLMVSPDDLKQAKGNLREGIKARATVGEDEKVYALSISGKPVPLACAGSLFEGRLRELFEKAEKRFEEFEKKSAA